VQLLAGPVDAGFIAHPSNVLKEEIEESPINVVSWRLFGFGDADDWWRGRNGSCFSDEEEK